MLHAFVNTHREAIVARARKRIAARIAPLATRKELDQGVGVFLDDLVAALEPTTEHRPATNATLQDGFTVAQVVYDFGDICQAITSEIAEQDVVIEAREFRILNQCLDDAIASAVTEFARRQQRKDVVRHTEALTDFVDELRPLLSSALLAYEMVQRGTVGASGSTGALVGRSLRALRKSVDNAVAIARLDRDAAVVEPVALHTVLEDVEVSAAIEAKGRGVRLSIGRPDGLLVLSDRDILGTAVTTLLESAIQATRRDATVDVAVRDGTGTSVNIEIDGGTPADGVDDDAISLAERAIGACGGTLETIVGPQTRRFRLVLPKANESR